MKDWGLDRLWRWHWPRGSQEELAKVWRDYGVAAQPGTNDVVHGLQLYLIDRNGFERTGYLFPFLPNFVQLDPTTLAAERAASLCSLRSASRPPAC